jgi:magnesium-transporting ATPase (P-type)
MIFVYVTITPPAGALSVQPASKTVMKEPPRPPTESIFNREIIMDTVAYSLGITIVCLVAFFVPLYTLGNGVEGVNCDSDFVESVCTSFYRARASLLVAFTFSALVIMIHCRSYRNCEWNVSGIKETLRSYTFVGSFIFDLVTLCIFMYIPKVAIEGFRMLGISWEWGLDWGLVLFMILYGEVFKLAKRTFLKPMDSGVVDEEFEQFDDNATITSK